ncbi:MAG TPA: hypothetical protein VFW98_01095 [Gemmatimonadaceae bacterium]|nr:hypothetical protein [Gemmatimonadaceae bacterium]
MRRAHATMSLLALASLLAPVAVIAQQSPTLTTALMSELHFRSIGPAVMGGRVHDIEALPTTPSTVYAATASGGLWKSTNKGTTWTSIFDGQATSSFGVVAIAPSNPNIIWAGTGEQNNRQSSTWGDGVYRSTDGGRTWTHLGLERTRAIGRVLVDPHNPDIAWVAALGNLWKPSPDRGVYKTTNGGKSWKKVLSVDTLTGVVDMVMDPTNSNVVYAAAYQRLRRPCCFNGGGPGSGIYKTTDGGAHWTELAHGLPTGDKGRIGLAISHTNPRLVYAIVEHPTAGGFYRSTDGGAHWTHMNSLDSRPVYYSTIYVDPSNDQRIYMLARYFYMSEDGGRTWRIMPTEPTYDVGLKGDYHSMWIDPHNTAHFYLAGDGGVYESWDRGATYVRLNNLPITQFYGIGVDNRSPYYIYGGLQDDHSWLGPSATRHWIGIVGTDWREIGFNDGLRQQVDLSGPRYVYSNAVEGDLTRVDAFTGDRADIHPVAPPGQPPYRFEWMSPGLASKHTAGTYYYGGNRLFITHDYGRTWEPTKDLTRQVDRDTMVMMGVADSSVTLSLNDGQTAFSAISAIAESPVDPMVLWVGTDDGNVQTSRDGGRTWTEVSHNIHGAPDGSYISRVQGSSAAPGAAYVTLDNHRRGDFHPYVFKTSDFGQNWTPIMQGLPPDGSARTILEYPGHPALLFLGTEHAFYASSDSGAHWTRVPGLPTTEYLDALVHPREHDLIVATHGRGLYILDDAAPLAEWAAGAAHESAHLFSIRPATIFQYWKDFSYRGQDAYAGENPPHGAILSYMVANAAPAAHITIANSSNDTVRTLDVSAKPGVLHRVVWDLRHEPPPSNEREREYNRIALPRPAEPTGARGPFVSPGIYTVTLEAGGARSSQTLRVNGDPKLPLTQAQYETRETFLVKLLALQDTAWALAQRADTLRRSQGGGATSAPASTGTRGARGGRGAGSGPAATLARTLNRLVRQAGGLASDFNGSGARSGTLYPPTLEQRRSFEQMQASLQKAATALARLQGRSAEGHR